jgi:hypothetical protein
MNYDHEACRAGLNLAADLLLAMAHEARKDGNLDSAGLVMGLSATMRALAVDDGTFRELMDGAVFAAPRGEA